MKTQNNSLDVITSKINRSKTATLFTILISCFIIFNSLEANAQYSYCPEGYTYTQVLSTYTFIDPVTNVPRTCPIWIGYCYKIGTNGTINFVLNEWNVYGDCFNQYDFNNPDFREGVTGIMLGQHLGNVSLQIPCPNHENIVILTLGSCWGSVYEPHPLGGGTTKYFPCGMESYCEYEYEFCFDFNVSPAKAMLTQISASAYGDPDCAPGAITVGSGTCNIFCE